VLAVILLIVSIPLWFIPPLILILPPLIWGWLTYRVMSFDALAAHASKDERKALMKKHKGNLLVIGIISGFLGAAPSLVWASGAMFAVLFPILSCVAIWIYTLVFGFASLWFSHFCLAALAEYRDEQAVVAGKTENTMNNVATQAIKSTPTTVQAPAPAVSPAIPPTTPPNLPNVERLN
jgi:hypothetical protein